MGTRVRFAPSPTGLLHLGGARTALFNYLYARANGGYSILRIEDTDKERYVPGSIETLEESLKWLGIDFHESPSKGGPYGPYIQSERLSLYQQYANILIQKGSGYPCFCSKERLQELRKRGQMSGYDGLCRSLSSRAVDKKLSMATPFTVRLKAPREGVVVIQDAVYQRVEVSGDSIEDQILLKTDGFPTYHLACVVDDRCMEISHVLRGEEWLLSTAKHLLLYGGLGWEPPLFAHLPLLLSSTGEKLSKRQQGASVESYKEKGFLPEAVVDFLAHLGLSGAGEDDQTKTPSSLEDLASTFSLERITKKAVSVDEQKLVWINKQHFKWKVQNPSECEELARQLQDELKEQQLQPSNHLEPEYLKKVLLLLEDRISTIQQIPQEASYFWHHPAPDREDLSLPADSGMQQASAVEVLVAVRDALRGTHSFSKAGITAALKGVAQKQNIHYSSVMKLCRTTVTGKLSSPSLNDVMELLGQEVVLERLDLAINRYT